MTLKITFRHLKVKRFRIMCAPQDKDFSFLLRDRLTKYCDDNNILLVLEGSSASNKVSKHKMLLDMIVYSSMGDEEKGLENVKETFNFLVTFQGMFIWDTDTWPWTRADTLMWEFWKSCFIRVKLALASGKQEQIAACKDYARYPRGYNAHIQNLVRSQLLNYVEEQIRIWYNDSKEVNNSVNRQE